MADEPHEPMPGTLRETGGDGRASRPRRRATQARRRAGAPPARIAAIPDRPRHVSCTVARRETRLQSVDQRVAAPAARLHDH